MSSTKKLFTINKQSSLEEGNKGQKEKAITFKLVKRRVPWTEDVSLN